eukprot:4507938-Prymnesium_polylepis.1
MRAHTCGESRELAGEHRREPPHQPSAARGVATRLGKKCMAGDTRRRGGHQKGARRGRAQSAGSGVRCRALLEEVAHSKCGAGRFSCAAGRMRGMQRSPSARARTRAMTPPSRSAR